MENEPSSSSVWAAVRDSLFHTFNLFFASFLSLCVEGYNILLSQEHEREGEEDLLGAGSGWVEARTSCDHLSTLFPDLSHIPAPDTSCTRCFHPAENWLCLSCKDVLCSRFVNKHMLNHHQETGHCLALSYSDLSVWCFACEAYLDAQVILQLQPVYEIAHLLKFGESPPVRSVECLQVGLHSM